MNTLKRLMGIEVEKKLTIIMLVLGLVMMFLIPTWQIPDEYTHLSRIGEAFGNENFAEIIQLNASITRGRIENNPDVKVDRDAFLEGLTASSGYDREDLQIKGLSLSLLKYFPAMLGLVGGALLELPVYWVLQLAEFCSLLFYIIICYLALKVMPVKKEMYAMIMMIPMALQQAGGITYDAVLIPLCFFWIAYLFHVKFKEKIRLKDFIVLIAVWLFITYIKLPYCFLMLLIFVLPLEKIHIRCGKYEINKTWIKKYGIFTCIVGVIVAIAAIYCVRDYKWIQILVGVTKEWRQALHLLKETGVVWHEMLITSSVGNFGWLDTPISYRVALLVYGAIFVVSMIKCGNKENNTLRVWDRFVIFGTVIVLSVFTTLGMLNHTIMVILYGSEFVEQTYDIQTALYQIPYIGGLQGRYYLPFVSLFFLPLPELIRVKGKKLWYVISAFTAVMFCYVIYILLNRYWIY